MATVGERPWPPEQHPTPEQWAAWVVTLSDAERAEVGAKAIEWSQVAMDCFTRNHDGLLGQLAAAEATAEKCRSRAETAEKVLAVAEAALARVEALADECERDDLWLVQWYGDGQAYSRRAEVVLRGPLAGDA